MARTRDRTSNPKKFARKVVKTRRTLKKFADKRTTDPKKLAKNVVNLRRKLSKGARGARRAASKTQGENLDRKAAARQFAAKKSQGRRGRSANRLTTERVARRSRSKFQRTGGIGSGTSRNAARVKRTGRRVVRRRGSSARRGTRA